jgi:hypothetical protein
MVIFCALLMDGYFLKAWSLPSVPVIYFGIFCLGYLSTCLS